MSLFPLLDTSVINAWRSKLFVGNRPINLGSTRTEQFFTVTPLGVYEILPSETGLRVCTGGGRSKSEQAYATAPIAAFSNFARGHTHPRGPRDYRLEQTPGPEDGAIAKQAARYGKPAYLIANRGCYRIFWTGENYDIDNVVGRRVRQSSLDKIAAEWLVPTPSSRVCRRFPD